ncbi:DNA polymerase/3'-5' exonuclease PolX [Pelotomaculum sp. FP]|uniref:DNA polymerase/3'-5' exonuclease PolX n=1 Tax=Pelotomaculum sp. FP TaxID=261474 RepID=UPI0010662AC4|nr:DNA polymerase/3'-5' exonuclease PolX [Pelotomaculum sp. FP]TEB14278.1 DNA polymerase/3'-5' exonuclease PolX [Pelotomaculum sp. FP]
MQNEEIAWIFHELADLLELKGEEYFKIRAYRNASRILAGLDEPVKDAWKGGRLNKIPGIGKNIAAKINELLTTGNLKKYQELLEEFPPGLLEIITLPGLGPKKAGMLREKLGITSLEELAAAAREKRLRNLPGLGVRTEDEILRNIELRQSQAGRALLDLARNIAAELTGYLGLLPGVARVEAGGSLRRWKETVGDIDLVVASDDPNTVIDSLAGHYRISHILEKGYDGAKFQTKCGIAVELEIVPEEVFTLALFRNTGSHAHFEKLQGLFEKRENSAAAALLGRTQGKMGEQDIYAMLDLQYIPPELREDRGEVEAALEKRLPDLVKLEAIKGDLHVHSTWSDGVADIEQLAGRAKAKGYQYMAVTDHSRSLHIARGLSLDKLHEQHEVIRELNKKQEDFQILTGIEVDILPKGELDCPDEVLKEIDVVVASVHSAFKQDWETMTARLLSALENRNVDIIGHPTGRLLNQREGYALDLERVLEAAAGYGTILEINASPNRLDLSDVNARRAKEKGIKLAINTDAHDLKRLDEMPYGVAVGRRAWLEEEDVVNTMPAEKLLKYLRRR